jgi:hypothetical protein
MSAVRNCETLFYEVERLGEGIRAIGDLLQLGKDDVYPGTLDGLAIVLQQLGKDMRNLNVQFLSGPFKDIMALETK